MKKNNETDLMGKIPILFSFLGVILSILSILAIVFACKVLFF